MVDTGATKPPAQYGSVDNVINYCEFEVSIIREPSIDDDHSDIQYFDGVLENVLSIEIRESVEQFYRTGVVTLADRSSLRELTPLTGNEIVSVSYKNRLHSAITDLKRKIVHFKIFHIEEYENLENRASRAGSSYINLHLVEWPAFDFLSTVVYQTFPISHTAEGGEKASTLVENLLKGIHGFENYYDISVDPSPEDLRIQNFYIPRWNVTKTLKYLSQFMISQDANPYYFFSIRSNPAGAGHKPQALYQSIYSYFNSPHFRTYSTTKPDTLFGAPAPSAVTGRSSESSNGIPKPEDDDNYDPLDTIFSRDIQFGNSNRTFQRLLSGRTVMNYDFREGNSHHAIDYRNFMKDYTTLGTTLANPKDMNFGNQWKIYETVPYNNEQMSNAYMRNKMAKGTFKEMFLTATCPVNETRTLGEKASLYLTAPIRQRGMDYQMSGRWMTYSVTDVITSAGMATSTVTFARDSFWLTEGDYLERSDNTWEDDISEGS